MKSTTSLRTILLLAITFFGITANQIVLADAAQKWKTAGTWAWVSHDGYNSKYGLLTNSAVDLNAPYGVTVGGLRLLNGPTDPRSITAASFWMKANVTGDGGGSPRLAITFSDGGNIQLHPINWTADTWQLVDGFSPHPNKNVGWDTNGLGGCKSSNTDNVTYAYVLDCLTPGAVITDISVVNDSGWTHPVDGEQFILDNISVNNIMAIDPGKSN
jgi:hypothetical protein